MYVSVAKIIGVIVSKRRCCLFERVKGHHLSTRSSFTHQCPVRPAGDDVGKLQRRQFTAGERSRPKRAGQTRDSAGARRGSHGVPGNAAGSGGVWRVGERPGSERRLAYPHRHPGRSQGRGGIPSAAVRPETRQRERADGDRRGPGLSRPRHD